MMVSLLIVGYNYPFGYNIYYIKDGSVCEFHDDTFDRFNREVGFNKFFSLNVPAPKEIQDSLIKELRHKVENFFKYSGFEIDKINIIDDISLIAVI